MTHTIVANFSSYESILPTFLRAHFCNEKLTYSGCNTCISHMIKPLLYWLVVFPRLICVYFCLSKHFFVNA